MADQLLDTIRDKIDGPIDFEGQRLADQIATSSLTICGILAFLVGWFTQDIRLVVYIMGTGTLAAFVAVIPAWPYLNKQPLQWLPSANDLAGLNITMTTSSE